METSLSPTHTFPLWLLPYATTSLAFHCPIFITPTLPISHSLLPILLSISFSPLHIWPASFIPPISLRLSILLPSIPSHDHLLNPTSPFITAILVFLPHYFIHIHSWLHAFSSILIYLFIPSKFLNIR